MVTDEKIAELRKLHRLHREGALSEDEFVTLKREIIEGGDSNVPQENEENEWKERCAAEVSQPDIFRFCATTNEFWRNYHTGLKAPYSPYANFTSQSFSEWCEISRNSPHDKTCN